MMGDTYSTTMQTSLIQQRVAFARRVLIYELMAAPLTISIRIPFTKCKISKTLPTPFELMAGVKGQGDDNNYYVEFRNVEANSEGCGQNGGGNLFGQDENNVGITERPETSGRYRDASGPQAMEEEAAEEKKAVVSGQRVPKPPTPRKLAPLGSGPAAAPGPALPPLQPMPPPSASSSNPITPRPKAPVRYSSFVKKVGMMPSLDPEPDDTEIKFMNVDVLEEEEEQVQQMRETPRQ